MSLPLKDLRFGVSAEAHSVLSAYARAHDLQLQEVCREVVEEWAMKWLHRTIVMHDELRRDGALPESPGRTRNRPE